MAANGEVETMEAWEDATTCPGTSKAATMAEVVAFESATVAAALEQPLAAKRGSVNAETEAVVMCYECEYY